MAYHYKDSGLDNVYLENGYTMHQTPYGEGIAIHDIDGLHKAIGLELIRSPAPLNGAEFRFLRIEMGLTQNNIADMIDADEQAVRRWEKNRTKPVKGPAALLMRAIYSEYIQGDGNVRRMIDRLAELDVADKGEIHFKETDKGWKGCIEACA